MFNEISREEFLKLKEEDVMLITNPGRMGDEDSSNFVVKKGDNYIKYRIDGLMYGEQNDKDYNYYSEVRKHFPKWDEVLKNRNNKDYHGKYTYVYMGFGNGLAIDNRIYEQYETYLLAEYEKEKKASDYQDDLPSFYYSSWESALEKMLSHRKK